MRRTPVALAALAAALTACSRELSVPAARPLTLTPATSSIAPRETLTFVAGGGAGGYSYALSGTPGSGGDAAIDAVTGAYRAGSTGPGTDVVVVTDAAGATASAAVTIGAMLAISSEQSLVVPGGHATFAATGGLPPYTFRFQQKGNRSGGTVDAVTGEYVAGPNPGAVDKLEVADAAGAVAQAPSISVGAVHLALPGGASELELGDLNGDGRADVVALEPEGSATVRMTALMRLPGGATVTDTYFLAGGSAISARDLTGDGRADVLPTISPSSSLSALFAADPAGRLVAADTLGAGVRLPRLPFVTGITGCGPWCTGGTGIYKVTWNRGSAGFDAAVLVTDVPVADLSHVGDLLPGNFDGTGATTQIAWLERDDENLGYGAGTAQLHYVNPSSPSVKLLGMPASGWSAVLASGETRQQLIGGKLRGGYTTDTAVLLVNARGRNVVKVVPAFTAGTSPSWVATELDPFPGRPPALGLARCAAAPGSSSDTAVTWNGTLRPVIVAFSAAGVPSVSTATSAAVHVPITVGACGDVNGDGVPDLALASGSTSTLALVWGDGDGGFGRRPHFQAPPVYTTARIDGDGVGDVVVATDVPSLVTFLGDEHQLARVAETPLSFAPAALWAGDLAGTTAAPFAGWAGDLVVADTASNLYAVRGSSAGVFGRPAQIRAAPDGTAGIPRILRVAFANLDGSSGGSDVVVLYEVDPPRLDFKNWRYIDGTYELDAIVRSATGTARVIPYRFSGAHADVQPVDLDGDGLDELVAVQGITTTASNGHSFEDRWRPLRLRVDPAGVGTVTLIGSLPSYTVAPNPDAVGRSDGAAGSGGVAVLAGGPYVYLVAGTGATAVTTTVAVGADVARRSAFGNVALPRAFLGEVTYPFGAPDLVFADLYGGPVHLLPGVVTNGRLSGFGASIDVTAPGIVAGILPQGATTPSDVLLFSGEEFIPLVWDGATLK